MDKALDANNFVPPPSGMTPASTSGSPADRTRVTLGQLKAMARKGGAASTEDPYWLSRLFYRRFTIYVTWLCTRLGISSNGATLLSAVAIFASALCYVAPSRFAWLSGALLVQVYFILDHVDGELARYETVHLGRTGSGSAGAFYDTCCHTGELALLGAIGLRMFAVTGEAWWVAVIALLTFFPGNIMPWQRYCEAVVGYARKHVEGDRAALAAEMVRSSSYALAPATGQTNAGRLVSALTQTIGFPGYFVTLLACTLLDVAGAPTLRVGGRAVPYLVLWLAVRAIHSGLAAIKSVRVYGRRLASLQ